MGTISKRGRAIRLADAGHRFEFATNEFINAMSCVTLETTSTETGSKEYIAVGTTINRGEDLAAKGTVGISRPFEIHNADALKFLDIYLRDCRSCSRCGSFSQEMVQATTSLSG
jgi:CPSF A subunit region